MKIIISPLAEKQLRKLSKLNQIIVSRRIRSLATVGSRVSAQRLSGYERIFRTRVGDLRIVYKKSKTALYIILIGHRKEVYEQLKRLLR